MGSREVNVGREGGMEGGGKKKREGGRGKVRERVGSSHIRFLNLNTCVGGCKATYRNVCHLW